MMRKRFYMVIVLLLMIGGMGAARATVLSNLNVASVPVTDTKKTTRERALPAALGDVLIKMSGNSSIMTLPAIQNAVDNVDELIKSYSYSREINDDGNAQLMLNVTFDRRALKKLLRQSGQADWSQQRPLTLLWVQIQDNANSTMLSNTDNPALSETILKTAKIRGVPVVLPSMDLDDQRFLKANQENFDPSLLQQAATRYGASAILAGKIQENNSGWHATWSLYFNDAPFHWQANADSLEDLCQKGINEMVNLMANQLAVVNDADLQTDVVLKVDNIQGLDDYAKVLVTLRHLSQVASVNVIDMDGSDLILNVKTIGGAQALSDALSEQSHFAAVETDANNKNVDLSYRWVNQYSRFKNNQDQRNG